MKTRLLLLITLLMALPIIAQNGINYKAVVKDASGNVIASDLIVVQFSIVKTTATGTTVYQENHTTTTDPNGIIVVNIGEGTPITGTFGAIDWASDAHFLKVEVNTGSGLVDMGTTEFKLVPYSIAASNIKLPYYDNTTTATNEAAFHVHNDNTNATYGVVGTTGTDGAIIPANRAGVLGYSTNAHGVYGLSENSFFAGVQGVSDSPTGVGVQGYGFGGGVGGHFYTTSSGVAALTTGVGNVGIGINSPVNPLSVLQSTGTANTVRIESEEHPSGKDLLELIVPAGSTSGSQFIEMQNGATIVAAVNSDGSAKFKSVQFEDNTVQNTSGPVAKAYLDAVSAVSTNVNVIGSSTLSATYNTTGNYLDVSLSGVFLAPSSYLVHATPIRVNTSSATVDRSASVYFTGGNVRIYVWDMSVGGSTFNDCFISVYKL
jgi:hypothetical protein